MTLKIETAATRSEIPAIAITNVVIVESVEVTLSIMRLLSWTVTVSSLRLSSSSIAVLTASTLLISSTTMLT